MALGIWMPFWKKRFNYFLNIIYMVDTLQEDDGLGENFSPENQILDTILSFRKKGQVYIPDLTQFKMAKRAAEQISNQEERDDVLNYLSHFEKLSYDTVKDAVATMDAMKTDPNKALSERQIALLTDNIEDVPSANWDELPTVVKESRQRNEQKALEKMENDKRFNTLVGRLNKEIGVKKSKQSGEMTLLDSGSALTDEEKKFILEFGGDKLSIEQVQYLEKGTIQVSKRVGPIEHSIILNDDGVDILGPLRNSNVMALDSNELKKRIAQGGQEEKLPKTSLWKRIFGKK